MALVAGRLQASQ
jgi:hypothetical protein